MTSATMRMMLLTLGVFSFTAMLRADAINGTIIEVSGNVATIKSTSPQLPKVGDRVEALGMMDGPGTELVVGRGRVIEIRNGAILAKMEGADPPPRGQTVRIIADAAGAKSDAGPASRVDRIEIVERGTYRIPSKPVSAPGDVVKIKETTTIPARKGVLFGLKYVVSGEPKGAKAALKIIVIYPEGGITNAKTGKTADKEEISEDRTVGPARCFWGVKLATEEMLVPGEWTCQIWCQDRKLAEQKFTLVRP